MRTLICYGSASSARPWLMSLEDLIHWLDTWQRYDLTQLTVVTL